MKRTNSGKLTMKVAGLVLTTLAAMVFSNVGHAASHPNGEIGLYKTEKSHKRLTQVERDALRKSKPTLKTAKATVVTTTASASVQPSPTQGIASTSTTEVKSTSVEVTPTPKFIEPLIEKADLVLEEDDDTELEDETQTEAPALEDEAPALEDKINPSTTQSSSTQLPPEVTTDTTTTATTTTSSSVDLPPTPPAKLLSDKNEAGAEAVDADRDTIFDEVLMTTVRAWFGFGRNQYRDADYRESLAKAFVHVYNGLKHVEVLKKGKNEPGDFPVPAYSKKSLKANGALTGDLVEVGGSASLGLKFSVVEDLQDVEEAADYSKGTVCGVEKDFDGFFTLAMTNNSGSNGTWLTVVNPDGSRTANVKSCLNNNQGTAFANDLTYQDIHIAGHHDAWMIEAILLMIVDGAAVYDASTFLRTRIYALRLPEGVSEKLRKQIREKNAAIKEGDAVLTTDNFQVL